MTRRRSRSNYDIYQEASLSQKAADTLKIGNIKILSKLSGTDSQISDSIAVLIYLTEKGVIEKNDSEFILGLLDVLRLSHFATSEHLNEITKLGFLLPKAEEIISSFNEEE